MKDALAVNVTVLHCHHQAEETMSRLHPKAPVSVTALRGRGILSGARDREAQLNTSAAVPMPRPWEEARFSPTGQTF